MRPRSALAIVPFLLTATILAVPLALSGADHVHRIGALLIMSGRAKYYGEVMNRGVQMAVEDVNAAVHDLTVILGPA